MFVVCRYAAFWFCMLILFPGIVWNSFIVYSIILVGFSRLSAYNDNFSSFPNLNLHMSFEYLLGLIPQEKYWMIMIMLSIILIFNSNDITSCVFSLSMLLTFGLRYICCITILKDSTFLILLKVLSRMYIEFYQMPFQQLWRRS